MSYEMIIGEGPYTGTDQQLNFDMAAFAQIKAAVKNAQNRIPSSK